MRNFMYATTIASVLLIGAGAVRSGDDNEARAIVDKAIKAMGGEAKLAKLKAMTWKEKGTYYGMGDGLPYMGEYAVQWPGQFRMDIQGAFTIVLNNDKGWTDSMGTVKEMSKEELAVQMHNQRAGWISSLVPLKDKAFILKSLGDAKIGKQAASVVAVTRPNSGYPDVKLYFSKDTGLLLKNEFRTKAPEQEMKEVTQSTYFSDFREVDGLKMPFKLEVKRDDKKFVEAEITDLKTPGKLDAKVFGKPGS